MNSFKRENTVPVRQVKILQPNHQPSRIGVQLLDICSWNIPGADVEDGRCREIYLCISTPVYNSCIACWFLVPLAICAAQAMCSHKQPFF